MHRLSRIARHTESTAKIIRPCSRNGQRNHPRSCSAVSRATSLEHLEPRRYARRLLDSSLTRHGNSRHGERSFIMYPRAPSLEHLESKKYGHLLDPSLPASRNGNEKRQSGRSFSIYSSYYHLHPEKLKQIIKERDGQSLCKFYDSDLYKQQAVDVLEEQNRIISDGTPMNLKDSDVSYEHVLNCAQPTRKPKVFVTQKKKDQEDSGTSRHKLARKGRPSGQKHKKEAEGTGLPVNQAQIVYAYSPSEKKDGMTIKDCRRKYRKRTTIMPIFIKKIQTNLAKKEKENANPTFIAQKFTSNNDDVNYEDQMLNMRKPIFIRKATYEDDIQQEAKEHRREKLMNIAYEEEALNLNRFKTKSKYSEGGEQNRHWHQKPRALKRVPKNTESEL